MGTRLLSFQHYKITRVPTGHRGLSQFFRQSPASHSLARYYTTPTPTSSHPPGALHGIRVLDLGRILAAPFGTMILGDLGAEVIKVEIPGMGDDTRHWGPPFTQDGSMSAYYACTNRNKKSITVDLKKPEGIQIIHELVKISDVFVENFLPGKLESMGLGYEQLIKMNSRLVYCSITGYGPDGPYSNRPGADVAVEALAGLMHITGYLDGKPAKVGVALTDVCTGLFAHGSILAALIARERTGKGQKIDCSLLETQVSCLVNIASNYLIAGQEAHRMGTSHPSIVPYQTFETADGIIMIGAINDNQFRKLMEVMGWKEVVEDMRFQTNPDRVKNKDILVNWIEEETRKRTTGEWLGLLEGTGIIFAPVNNIEGTFKDPQVIHRNMVEEVEHPNYGKIKLTGIPVKFSETKANIRMPPPLLGEHTEEVLLGVLGYSQEKIDSLKKGGII